MRPRASIPRRVTVLGLGLFGGGAGAARYFAERGAKVIVTDARPASALAESLQALRDLPIECRLGGHSEEDFAGAEVVIVNPAVPPDAPALEMARRSGARLDTEINMLFRLAPAPIAAVTGTNGKSTTTALLGQMIRQTGRRVWVGGNLGGSLLPEVERMSPEDVVVIEISSFQCQRLAWARISPHLGMVLNITPNHLDRHRDMAEYAAAKRQLLVNQGPEDFAVLNAEDPTLRKWTRAGRGRKYFFGASARARRGIRLEGERARLWDERGELSISLAGLRLPGAHNRFNAACAAAAAWLLGAGARDIESALATFQGLPDRIEFVQQKDGVRYYNDSIATTPESTIAALESFEAPVILIAGGSSKNLSFAEVGKRIAARAKAVILIGQTAPEIEMAIRAAPSPAPPISRASTIEEAVLKAREVARPGDVVLLSPACASFDMFRNYAERGERFRAAVRAL